MTKDEALDLALEALEYFTDTSVSAMDHAMAEDAITAIKQARALDRMAENARELGLDYEPVPENFMDALRFDVAMRDAQEPAAWMFPDDLKRFETSEAYAEAYSIKMGSPTQGETVPLYTTPPAAQRQWVEVQQVKWDGEKLIAKLKEKNT